VRTIRIVLALAILLVVASPVQGATPDSSDAARLATKLRDVRYARLGIAGRTVVVADPCVTREGIAYATIDIDPKRRSPTAPPESIAETPNPVAWSSIDRIEAEIRTRRPGAITGACIGFLVGVGVGLGSMAVSERSVEHPWRQAFASGLFVASWGAGIGAAFPSTRWKQIHPEVVEPATR
jgi:hypothetical protein